MRRALICLAAACSSDPPFGDPLEACGDGLRQEFETCDDGNRDEGDGCNRFCQTEPLVTVTWVFYPQLGMPAQTTGCRAGVAEVELVTDLGTSARLPCDDRRSGGLYVPEGQRVITRLRAADATIVAESLPVTPRFSARVETPFYEDAGYIRASTPIEGPCVTIMLTLIDEASVATNLTLSCDGINVVLATSPPLRAGTYTVRFHNPFGVLAERSGVVVRENNRVTDVQF